MKKQNLPLNYKANIFSVDIDHKHFIKGIVRLDKSYSFTADTFVTQQTY